MIAKSGTGASFKGLGKYLEYGNKQNPERVEWQTTRNLPSDLSIKDISKLMQATANQNNRVKKPLYHLSISWDESDKDKVNQKSMETLADKVLSKLGLQDHQSLIVSHDDTNHKHIHIMVNRVHPETLKAKTMSHDYTKIQKVLREEEIKHDLRQVKGTLYSLDNKFAEPSRENEYRKIIKDKGLSFNELAKEKATPVFREAQSWQELEQNLETKGLYLTKKGRGMVLTDKTDYIKCSSIDRNFSINNLEKKFGISYDNKDLEQTPNLTQSKNTNLDLDNKQLNNKINPSELNINNNQKSHEQNIERKSGTRNPELHQGSNQSTPQRDSRDDLDHQQRRTRQSQTNTPRNQYTASQNGDSGNKVNNKDNNNLHIGEFPNDSRNASFRLWRKRVEGFETSLLKTEHKKIHNTHQKIDNVINDYDDLKKSTEEQKMDIRKNLSDTYKHDMYATQKYEEIKEQQGVDKANAIFYNNPQEYGRLKGFAFMGFKSPARKEALRKVKAMPEQFNDLHRTNAIINCSKSQYFKALYYKPLSQEKVNMINQYLSKKISQEKEINKNLGISNDYNNNPNYSNKPTKNNDKGLSKGGGFSLGM